jgi:hypothetical protein
VAIYTETKAGVGDLFPKGAVEEDWRRTEPLITPDKLVSRHLFGIPLVSGIKDPITGKAQVMTKDILIDYIDRAVSTVEMETGMTIFPTPIKEKLPFDRQEFQSFGYMRLPHRPVSSVEHLAIVPSNQQEIFIVPIDWIDIGQMYHGQINIIPLTIALTSAGAPQSSIVSTAGGAALLAILNNSQWIASYWQISYTAGFPDGKIPKVLNDLIGIVASMEVLSMLAATYGKNSGSSLSIDGMSQSISTPGPEIFTRRIEDLQKKRDLLVRKLKAWSGTILFSGNV